MLAFIAVYGQVGYLDKYPSEGETGSCHTRSSTTLNHPETKLTNTYLHMTRSGHGGMAVPLNTTTGQIYLEGGGKPGIIELPTGTIKRGKDNLPGTVTLEDVYAQYAEDQRALMTTPAQRHTQPSFFSSFLPVCFARTFDMSGWNFGIGRQFVGRSAVLSLATFDSSKQLPL